MEIGISLEGRNLISRINLQYSNNGAKQERCQNKDTIMKSEEGQAGKGTDRQRDREAGGQAAGQKHSRVTDGRATEG